MLARIFHEIGLDTLLHSSWDVYLLCFQRFARMFAYGQTTIIFTLFFVVLGINEEQVGIFMTYTLLGDVIISFGCVLVADRVGRRKVLATGSILMCISGITFSYASNFWILLSAAVFGVISPSGSEIGPFKTIEESTLAHLSDLTTRSDLYAWYNLLGGVGLAIGTISGGWIVQILQDYYAWSALASFRCIFVMYSIIAVLKLLASLLLSSKVELHMTAAQHEDLDDYDSDGEENPLLENSLPGNADNISNDPALRVDVPENVESTTVSTDCHRQQPVTSSTTKSWRRIFPQLSSQSWKIVLQLVFLFSIDSFASGIATQSWLSYYFSERFDTRESTLGTLFFVTNLISAASSILAAPLSKRLGLIKTIAFTHLPSSIFLSMMGLPSSQYLAMMLLILRSCTQRMDYGPTQAFVSAIVLKEERTSVMGIVNLTNTFAQSLSPLAIGKLAFLSLMPIGFSLAGICKVFYDISLLVVFVGQKLHDK
ncbi:major facilitator superfamily domain-containing protein [Lipomyces orientalis]|uniref:Major facilitator superfamily domain-containing protein n=1 Tax=Lipomyces orientalis TaxID=1233043 RepID=A0ACC3TIQ8_9ASCO